MITSLRVLNNLLQPEEEYLWHGKALSDTPNLGAWGWFTLLSVTSVGLICSGGPSAILGALNLTATLFIAWKVAQQDQQVLVITNRRIIRIDGTGEILEECSFAELSADHEKFGLITITANGREKRMRVLCHTSRKHAEHLAGHFEPGRLLSS